jgi:hypothetical protein
MGCTLEEIEGEMPSDCKVLWSLCGTHPARVLATRFRRGHALRYIQEVLAPGTPPYASIASQPAASQMTAQRALTSRSSQRWRALGLGGECRKRTAHIGQGRLFHTGAPQESRKSLGRRDTITSWKVSRDKVNKRWPLRWQQQLQNVFTFAATCQQRSDQP